MRMPFQNRVTQCLNIEHPVLLAPMDLVSGGRLAASVSQAGGLGLLGGGYGDGAWLDQEWARAGNARIGCGFITWSLARQPGLLDRVLAHQTAAVMLSFGDPRPFGAQVRSAGTRLICQVQTVQQAREAVEAGADIIVAQGTEAAALNRAVRNACQKGVVFITWDAQVTEPCAYYVGINQEWAGAGPAEWLAQELKGKGNIIFMGGIPGTMVDTRRNAAAKGVFAESPDIHIIADVPSMWNNATARQKLAEIIGAQGWDKINGLWTQTGC